MSVLYCTELRLGDVVEVNLARGDVLRVEVAIPKVDLIILAHFRFGHAQCQRIDALTESATPTGIPLGKGALARCDPTE
eukprot:479400-Prorocentrum_minimum.AAC.1